MSFSLSQILEKMKSRDKDYRYMATSDLIVELNNDNFTIDNSSQKQLVKQVLDLLDDNSNDVQEISAKCLGPLVKNISEVHVLTIATTLVGHLLNDDKKKDELRDISSIGLKTVFAELNVNDPATANVVESLAKKLVAGLVADDDKTPQREQHLLEVLAVLLERFGTLVTQREKLQKALLPLLLSSRQATRKRAIDCLSLLSIHSPHLLFNKLITHLVQKSDSEKAQHARTMIQCVAAVSKTVGFKLGPHLNQLVPIVLQFCNDERFDQDEDLRENCLQCFETLIQRCPKDIAEHIDAIEEISLKYLSFDPNYAADSDDEDEDNAMEEDEFDDDDAFEDEYSDELYSDDDDMSWKVRRACARCLSAVVEARPERTVNSYKTVAPVLIKRFSEREENVRLDVFDAFRALLRQTRRLMPSAPRVTGVSTSTTASAPAASSDRLAAALSDITPSLITALSKQAKTKEAKTRLGALAVLRALVACASAKTLAPHAALLVASVERSLAASDKDGSNLRIEALVLLRHLLSDADPQTYVPHVQTLTPLVVAAVGDGYYRVSADALRTTAALVPALAAAPRDALVENVHTAVMAKMELADIDQDVKEAAIACLGQELALVGDSLEKQLPAALSLLQERMCNEITRLTAVVALGVIARSSLHLDLSSILSDATGELANLLRQANRQLRQAVLITLTDLAANYGKDKACHGKFKDVIAELPSLLSDTDLHLAHLALQLATTLIKTYPKCASTAVDTLLEPLKTLIGSSLLQGVALASVRSLCKQLATDGKRAKKLVSELRELVAKDATLGGESGGVSAVAAGAAAQCVAEAASAGDAALVPGLVDTLLSELKGKKIGDARRVADLLTLGELGRRVELEQVDAVAKVLLSNFEGVEDVKQAAAVALGSAALGNIEKLLPLTLKELESSDKQYLLVCSLRETAARAATTDNGAALLESWLDKILPPLIERAATGEEGARTVVAECLGKLALLQPKRVVPTVAELLSADSAAGRATGVAALRASIVERAHAVDALLAPLVPNVLLLLGDNDIAVRKSTLLFFHYAAHAKASLVAPHVAANLEALYGEAKIKPELIREVDLGPFKHKVDDGLEVRKAAYECMYTLLAAFGRTLSMEPFVAALAEALDDEYDIAMLAHLIIIRVAAVAPASLLEGLEQLIEPLKKTLQKKAKENAIKQEQERVQEAVRSAMRAVRAIQALDGSEASGKFQSMVQSVLLEGELAEQYKSVLNEEGTNDSLASSLTASQRANFGN